MRMLFFAVLLTLPVIASADLTADPDGDVPAADGLSGRDVYERVVAHGLSSFEFEAWLVSGNGYGDERRCGFRLRWKDDSHDPRMREKGLRSVAIINPTEPFNLRFLGYRIEQRAESEPEQFSYTSPTRRIRRLLLRGLNIYGSEFSFNDIVPREAEDFRYRRLPDETVEGAPVYAVELLPRAGVDSEHSRILVYAEKARDVIRVARYFDARGVETRRLTLGTLERFGDSWIPMRWTIRNLASGGYSNLSIEKFRANPVFPDRAFSFGLLESK